MDIATRELIRDEIARITEIPVSLAGEKIMLKGLVIDLLKRQIKIDSDFKLESEKLKEIKCLLQ